MAMVLDAFASYVGDLLRQVVEEELGTMLGVSGEINKMDEKLRDLKNFLTDADRRNITDESVQEWVGQLKSAMYEATDILDLCQLKAMEHGPSTVEAGCFNPLLFCMRNPSHAREIGTRIKKLNQWLNSIKERSTAFNFINLRSYDDCSSNVHASQHGNPSRETVGDFDQLGVVGEKIEEDTRALVARIMQTSEEVNDNIILVAIVGVGGIGKTTLAQKVFNDETIQGEFSKRLWLSVNQNISEIELLRRGIIEAGGDAQPAGNAKATLHRILRDALIGHKILLVMDDVWNHGAWDDVLKIPLVNAAASGSRVLITTRDEGVARAMKATWPFHNINTLTYDDAWSLLKKQALSGVMDEEHINTLKDIGLKIIQKCGGLPLAIKVMGGLLCRRGALLREWEHVLDDSKWSITGMPQVINSAVYLSYEDMPPHLKQCFLYYSLLPKGRKFHVDHVIAMWISEGFIHGDSNDLEEFGRNYYNELISRNLIEIDKSYIDRWYCSMHDVVRSFAQYMTKDETLVTHNGDINILTKLHSPKLLRLSIETTNQMESGVLEWKSLQDQQSVRTLISTIQIKMKPGDSLVTFSSLRTLHIEYADVAMLVESLHQLKHLRYLALLNTDISVLPEKIGKMKLMQFLDLRGCKKLVKLPDSIVMLSQLRLLTLANASMIPRGFRALINMRRLALFRAHMDGDWCSLDELGPLSQLRRLELIQLENVSASSSAANARLSQKTYLADLCLYCTSRLGHDGLVKEKESVSEEEQRQTEKVFDELCPPCSVENIEIKGYFGLQLPSWMMSMVPLNNLKTLLLLDLVCCTQLPNGLCQLPYLRLLKVERAPCIRHVGARFLQAATAPFPRLNKMNLIGMLQWEEWDWEEQVQAMPRLEELILNKCKLRHVPPGLAFNARALKLLHIHNVQHLSYLENFPSVVELRVCESPDLERITNLPNLQKLAITSCPNLKVLESIPAIERLFLKDYLMEQLPEYMRDIKSRHLQLFCRLWLLSSIATGQSGTEWDKFSHVQHVKAYAPDKDNPRKWYVSYTRSDKCKLDSNISSFAALEETLSSSMVDAQGFESMYKMRRSTFSYVCDLVMVSFLEDKMASDHTFVDGKVMSLQDRVAVALIMLNSGEPPVVVGSSLGVSELTVSTVTQIFVEAMWERAFHHAYWPCSDKVKKIKHKFDKIHGLPNCCGVVHTDHMIFGTQNRDHDDEENVYSSVIHIVVDSSLRFMTISLDWSGSMDQSSFLHDSWLFDRCEEGTWLMGGKLELANGMDVGEYIIGDTRYPLRPWLLTPYNLEDKDPSADIPPYQAEFNKRHSSASTLTLAALERLKDTWKILDKAVSSCPLPQKTIYACCMLHNIVIDMEEEEEEEGAGMGVKGDYTVRVRQVADEDAVRTRDALSQHLMESRAAEEEQEPSRRQKQTEERRKFMITRPWKWRQTDAAARIKSWAGKKES